MSTTLPLPTRIQDLDTPAVICDLDVMEKNLREMAAHCRELGIPLRAHTKSHRIPELAHRQMASGCVGIACQKLGDVEVMVMGGLKEILIPYNIVGAVKVERLLRLVRRAPVMTSLDSETTARGIAEQAGPAGVKVPVIIEMDTGAKRCGVQSPEEAQKLGRVVNDLPGLELRGVMTYPSRRDAKPFLDEVKERFKKDGLPIDIVSGGGTGSEAVSKEIGCTETRSGSYIWEGLKRVGKSEDLSAERCPVRVVCTVVSVPTSDRMIIDGGMKTFASYPPTPYGYCVEHPEIRIARMSVEHGHIDTTGSSHKFKVGERLTFIPLHQEMCLNLHDEVVGVRGDRVEVVWPVAGRGKVK
jgi:D-serine deaminase-like pyridoxal phosphate-dependent protein